NPLSSRFRGFGFLAALLLAGAGLRGARPDDPSAQPDAGNLRSFIELARKDVRAEKALLLAQNMEFTDDEAATFWPIYNEYELDLSKWYDRRLALIRDYLNQESTLTDEGARKLASEVFSMEEDRTALKRKYFKKFSKVVGPKKAARFFQIEN